MRSELRSRIPPRTGGEVGVQQQGGKHSPVPGREFGEFPSSACMHSPHCWHSDTSGNLHCVQPLQCTTITVHIQATD